MRQALKSRQGDICSGEDSSRLGLGARRVSMGLHFGDHKSGAAFLKRSQWWMQRSSLIHSEKVPRLRRQFHANRGLTVCPKFQRASASLVVASLFRVGELPGKDSNLE